MSIHPNSLSICFLHGRPQIGEVTCGGSPHLSCKRDQIKMRDYMDRRVTPPKRVASPTWGPPHPCKLALSQFIFLCKTLQGITVVIIVTARRTQMSSHIDTGSYRLRYWRES